MESRGGRLLNMGEIWFERSASFRTCRSHKMTITQPANSATQVSKHDLKTLKIRQPPVDLNCESVTAMEQEKSIWWLSVSSKFLK